ncbi:cupin domain-containing protein [Stenotrophomonas sp. MMGLT7]|uniref:cupin domain-containing protein n=1 Tax=Stenotrophomonas sp. MMGLT7 TaxID=2901227 RepID=UPI001E2A5C90|nr:cupin domain-containing protein [Stenotrophomonas sp. MMGLT7]MCD7099293.1 cupin domain-containing protein [Stenotrophomonas sp. MMGLT7]
MPIDLSRRRLLALAASMTVLDAAAASPATPPQTLVFDDDGSIPNSRLPLLLYRGAFAARADAGARWLEQRFASNGWTGAWRWTVYPFHHYHSNTHEVLGVFSGSATLQLGGENGQAVEVAAGDVIVIPAGVGHKRLRASDGFQLVGAYPDGRSPDLMRGEDGERPAADLRIAQVPLPARDPLLGEGGLCSLWR